LRISNQIGINLFQYRIKVFDFEFLVISNCSYVTMLYIKLTVIKHLLSDRLILREAVTNDASFVLELVNTSGWLQHIGDRGVRTLDEARKYIDERLISSYQTLGFGSMVITLGKENIPIGLCGLLKRKYLEYPDLGFAILPDFEGKGYVTEAALKVLNYAFTDLGLEQIYGITKEQNKRSKNLLLRLGFHFDGKIKPESESHELLLYSIGPPAPTPN